MSKAILNNDVIDVIYDSICGYPLEDAYKILEDHRRGRYIPTDWIEHYVKNKFCLADWYGGFIGGINMMLDDWEKENEELV